jgi:hypothetical protein
MAQSSLTLQLLEWIAARPRTYGETMDAWRTTCPRMSIWEDAVSDGVVAVEQTGAMRDARVHLTEAGREILRANGASVGIEPARMVHI